MHSQYLSDEVLLAQYEHFLEWQVAYSLPFYAEFQETPETAAAVEFVVSDLIGTGVSTRDLELARVVPIMVRLLPEKALSSLASAMELNARALQVNLDICGCLYAMPGIEAGISEELYSKAFRQSTSLDECLELINLTIELGHALESMVNSRTLGVTLRAMHYPAHAAGFGVMQDFLEKGYFTFRAIDDVAYFLDRLRIRMTEVFTRVCEPVND